MPAVGSAAAVVFELGALVFRELGFGVEIVLALDSFGRLDAIAGEKLRRIDRRLGDARVKNRIIAEAKQLCLLLLGLRDIRHFGAEKMVSAILRGRLGTDGERKCNDQ